MTDLPQLRFLRIELLRACPLACLHCSAESGPGRPQRIMLHEARALIQEAARSGVEEIVLTGGEPLLHPELRSILETAHNPGHLTTLYTTGISVCGATKTVNHELLADLAPLVDKFIFSLYSHDPGTHDKITTISGSWRMTMEAIAAVRALDVRVDISFLPLNGNWPDLSGVAELAADNGVAEVRILKLMRQGRAARNDSLNDPPLADFAELVGASRRANPHLAIRIGGAGGVFGDSSECSAPINELFVSVDGWVSACPAAYPSGNHSFSNVFADGLERVWERSEQLTSLRCLQTRGFSCGEEGCLAKRVNCAQPPIAHSLTSRAPLRSSNRHSERGP